MPKQRCTGITRDKKRCKLPSSKGSNRCAQHKISYVNAVKKSAKLKKKPRSNIGKTHQYLYPLPCTITQLLKKSLKGKIYTFRKAKSSGIRYKQYCSKK